MKKNILSLALLTCGLIPLSANAAVSWNITTLSGSNTTPTPAYGNERDYSTSSVGVSVTGFAATAGTNTTSAIDLNRNTRTLETAYLSIYTPNNGLGIVNRDGSNSSSVAITSSTGTDGNEYVNGGSEHSMDNNGRSEVMLLTFTDIVALNSLKLGWTTNDSDLFVLAWVGAGDPTASLTTKTFANISADTANGGDGWTLIANLSNVGTTNPASFNTTTPVSSSYWLIGTGGFSSAATGGGVTSGDKNTDGTWKAFGSTGAKYDYVKLAGIGGTKADTPPGNSVPEPGTLGLAGAALFTITALRRRKKVD